MLDLINLICRRQAADLNSPVKQGNRLTKSASRVELRNKPQKQK